MVMQVDVNVKNNSNKPLRFISRQVLFFDTINGNVIIFRVTARNLFDFWSKIADKIPNLKDFSDIEEKNLFIYQGKILT